MRTSVALAAGAVAVAAGLLVFGGGGTKGARPGGSAQAFRYPAASLADASFTADPAGQGRGIRQSITRVMLADGVAVAVGSQAGARITRAQFFVSADGGRTWRIAPVSAAGGGVPPPGHVPVLVAGGHGAWLAIGQNAIWTSGNGLSWILSARHGVTPLHHGDQVWVLTRTASGFLAGGVNAHGGDTTGVFWTSADGLNWRRNDTRQLGTVAGEHVLSINYAASRGQDVVLAGAISKNRAAGSGTYRIMGAWHGADGGARWARVQIPVSAGAGSWINGVAASGSGFLAVRPQRSASGGNDGGAAYVSANGLSWTYAGRIGTPGSGVQPNVVKAGAHGFVVTGETAGRSLVAFVSADGRSWRQTGTFGSAAAESLTGVTVTPGGTVIAVGMTTSDPVSQRPVLALAAGTGPAVNVDIGAIPHATDPELTVDGIAASGTQQVAVGSANGYPAIWSATAGGSLTRASGAQPAVLTRPGLQGLTGVVHGPAGWLAVGAVRAAAPAHPVVVTSAAGTTWQAVDGEQAFAAPGASAYQAAAGPSGYVVVGTQVTGGRVIAAAWRSAGLTGWQRAADAAKGDLDGTDAARQMLAVTAQPFGFIAVGSHGNHPAAWTSADGRTWRLTDLPLPCAAAGAVLTNVAAHAGRIVALGNCGAAAFAAVSADSGQTWQETALRAPRGPASVTALTASGSGFTAAGTYGRPGTGDVVIWSSADGRTWRMAAPKGTGLSGPGVQAITALTVAGRTLTGVGYTASPAGEHPTLWLVRLP